MQSGDSETPLRLTIINEYRSTQPTSPEKLLKTSPDLLLCQAGNLDAFPLQYSVYYGVSWYHNLLYLALGIIALSYPVIAVSNRTYLAPSGRESEFPRTRVATWRSLLQKTQFLTARSIDCDSRKLTVCGTNSIPNHYPTLAFTTSFQLFAHHRWLIVRCVSPVWLTVYA